MPVLVARVPNDMTRMAQGERQLAALHGEQAAEAAGPVTPLF